MALDTRQKRFSMLALASGADGCSLHSLFEADGTIAADDRARMLDLYSGIALSPINVVIGSSELRGIRNIASDLRGIRDLTGNLRGEVD